MKRFGMLSTLAVSLAALTGAALSARAAGQGVKPSWARWRLELTGDNGRAHAVWTVIIGGDDKDGCPVVLHQEPMELSCKAVGRAGVKGDTLFFDGGHFECDFPDLIREANRIILPRWGKECLLGRTGEGECHPMQFAYAKAELLLRDQGKVPVFHHPSLRFGLTVQKNDVQTYFFFGGRDSTGRPAKVAQQTTFESRLVRHGKPCRDRDGFFTFEHFIAGNDVGTDKEDYRPRLETGPVTVHIGAIPGSRETFQGTLERLDVDPGCRVN